METRSFLVYGIAMGPPGCGQPYTAEPLIFALFGIGRLIFRFSTVVNGPESSGVVLLSLLEVAKPFELVGAAEKLGLLRRAAELSFGFPTGFEPDFPNSWYSRMKLSMSLLSAAMLRVQLGLLSKMLPSAQSSMQGHMSASLFKVWRTSESFALIGSGNLGAKSPGPLVKRGRLLSGSSTDVASGYPSSSKTTMTE